MIVSPFSYSFAETQTNIKNNIKIASPSTLLPGSPSKELTLVTVNTTGKIIGAIIAWFIALTAVLAVLAITWGSIQMVLAI